MRMVEWYFSPQLIMPRKASEDRGRVLYVRACVWRARVYASDRVRSQYPLRKSAVVLVDEYVQG